MSIHRTDFACNGLWEEFRLRKTIALNEEKYDNNMLQQIRPHYEIGQVKQ